MVLQNNEYDQRHLSEPPLSKPALKVISINIEGFSEIKSTILAELGNTTHCDILCVQETHRGHEQQRPRIPGWTLTAEIPHDKHGSAIFTKPNINVTSTSCKSDNSIEIITVDIGTCTVTSVYKPPNQPFEFNKTTNFDDRVIKIIVGDFNSHNLSWGYRKSNPDGIAVEEWADSLDLSLIHDPKLPPSFNSCRWKKGYNPDLIFVSSNISSLCSKSTCTPIPNTQHRPIACQVQAAITPRQVPFMRRFNLSKANWDGFAKCVDSRLDKVEPVPDNYEKFIEVIRKASRQNIPRGCRSSYIPGLTNDSAALLRSYEQLYTNDPFSEETLNAGNELMLMVSENRRETWMSTVSNINMTHNSKKAWTTIQKLTGNPPTATNQGHVTANQVAHQLLLNSKPPKQLPRLQKTKISDKNNSNEISKPFTLTEIILAIRALKNGKAAGVDDLLVDQIKHLGPIGVSWLLMCFNNCLETKKIPKMWRRAKVVALLKPGKPPSEPKSYRPISLLCHLYKLFERLLLNRLTPIIEPQLIPEQAGFRPGKACCGQTLKLTQHIEDGFEANSITGLVLVDLSAAYDTVNVKRLLRKVEHLTCDLGFVQILGELLHNRRFQVHLLSEKSRWRCLKNGLPQGSVLAPTLFNIYTNDQPNSPSTSRFLYADDLALTTQTSTFEEAEDKLTLALAELGSYYEENGLKPNPSKTQSCAFHLRNQQASRTLNITWQGVPIQHENFPKYLGVTLDRSLNYKAQCYKTKMKVGTRNNLLRRLITTKWGAAPDVLRTTGLALCFSSGEYACPVWSRSAHAKVVDVALNDTCRIITGCLKPTPLNLIYPLAGISPPGVRRDVACSIEKHKQEHDYRHPLYDHNIPQGRLKSRKSFQRFTRATSDDPAATRRTLWIKRNSPPPDFTTPQEQLPPGHDLQWPVWKSLNRLRTQVGRCRLSMCKWGFRDPNLTQCDCGDPTQSMQHLLMCPLCPNTCTMEDLMAASPDAISVAKHLSTIL